VSYLLGLKEFLTKKDLGMKVIEKYTKVTDKQALTITKISAKVSEQRRSNVERLFPGCVPTAAVPENERAGYLSKFD
jgi:hypothetical protein